MPYAQAPIPFMTFVVRTSRPVETMVPSLRRAASDVHARIPLYKFRTLDEVRSESTAHPRYQSQLLAIFALISLTLASVGVYGLVSFIVSSRRREFGIRIAVGAQSRAIGRMVLAETLRLAFFGASLGLLSALIAARFIESMLFGVGWNDPTTLLAAPLVLVLTMLAASLLPALTASRVDPLDALRSE